jgi:anti-anti-sigma factor
VASTRFVIVVADGDSPPVRIAVRGDVDLAVVRQLREALLSADREVELDLGQVTFLDVSGLRTLIDCRAELLARGVPLRVTAMSQPVSRLVDLLHLDGALLHSATTKVGA